MDAFGTALIICFWNASCTGADFSAATVALWIASNTDAGIAHLAGIGLGPINELRIGLRRETLGGGGEDQRHLAKPSHHDDFFFVIDLELILVDDRRQRIGAWIADLERVAVRPR